MEMAICNGAAYLSSLEELPTRKHLTMALNGHWFFATSNASLVLGLIAKLRLITCEGIEMSAQKHMQEPWPYFVDIATTMTPDPEGPLAAIISPEDYMRARACVNACAGIATSDLETKPLFSDRVVVMHHEVSKQRDELLAALKEYIDALDETVQGDDHVSAMIRYGEADKQARAAIAKVESK